MVGVRWMVVADYPSENAAARADISLTLIHHHLAKKYFADNEILWVIGERSDGNGDVWKDGQVYDPLFDPGRVVQSCQRLYSQTSHYTTTYQHTYPFTYPDMATSVLSY